MLHDRPEMARHGESGQPLEEWAARKFAGEDLGRRIYWDPAEPPSFTFGENHVLPGERGAIIRVGKNVCGGKEKGNPQSFDQLWSGAVFELYNIANGADSYRIDYELRRGTITREEYVERIWQCEWHAAQKTRAFYIRVFLPWARSRHVPSHPDAWYLTSGSSSKFRDVSWQPGPYELQYDLREFTRLLENREYVKANQLAQLRLKLSVSPEERAIAYSMCGVSALVSRSYPAAIELFDRAVKSNKNESLAFTGRGATRMAMGDTNGAIADYSEAIRLNPSDADAYLSRSEVYRTSGDDKKASADIAEATRLRVQQSREDNDAGGVGGDPRTRNLIPHNQLDGPHP